MGPDLDVSVYKSGDISVIGLSGDVDTFTCAKLRDAVAQLIDAGVSWVVINMSAVDYIDSSGLGTLVGALRRVNESQGGLAISNAAPQVLKVLNITGLSKVFALYQDDHQAAVSLSEMKN